MSDERRGRRQQKIRRARRALVDRHAQRREHRDEVREQKARER